MTDIGPWMVTAHTCEQARYVARSQAELQGCEVTGLSVSGGAGGMWHVSVTVADDTGHPENAADDVQVIDLDAR
ncbi:MAG TPA: hypothetical protein VHW92_11740 [Mycobacteriales bacterium]|jgi:hypothetical protein|nr:hypothetical protein [Mycobacteriales bacterium]